eukprot:gene24746-10384_t
MAIDPRFDAFEKKMKAKGCSEAAINAFRNNYTQLTVANFTGLELLSQTAVLKLNGGLGTSMGLEKAKSLLIVKDGKTFLRPHR